MQSVKYKLFMLSVFMLNATMMSDVILSWGSITNQGTTTLNIMTLIMTLNKMKFSIMTLIKMTHNTQHNEITTHYT
jgi:hypothetical protein